MIQTEDFFAALKHAGFNFYAGVPDSLLSNLCAYIDDQCSKDEHVITANEGNAIATAAGYYLSTGNFSAVYMQNSGLGNTVNPLTSLVDAEVYRIPMLLIIGWRGEPGVKDEPQHIKQGRITPGQLDLLEIPYQIIDAQSDATAVVDQALKTLLNVQAPVALLIKKNTFTPYKSKREPTILSSLTREAALSCILSLSGDSLVVSTTGKTSREVFELRVSRKETQRDFLTVGAMGHTASIALGVAMGNPSKQVICLDGDGSALMHLGALPIIGSCQPKNLIHVLLNNAAHESVGGQPTVGDKVDFGAIAKASGYRHYAKVNSLAGIRQAWAELSKTSGPCMLEICVKTGSRPDLGRPTNSPEENKHAFIQVART